MSKILKRQLRRHHLAENELPDNKEDWTAFLRAIEAAYVQAQEDRYLLERSLEISSEEMRQEIERNKKMSIQLAQAGKMASLGTLASGVAHELNNPLAIIKGFAELMHITSDLSKEDQYNIEQIIKTCNRMSDVIKHMLKLARQGDTSDDSIIDIREPIKDILGLLERQFTVDNITVSTVLEAANYTILGNKNTFSGIFQNLLTNSRDAFIENGCKGEIQIQIQAKNEHIEINYTDNAGGMSQEVLEKIFDPFYTTKEVGTGTGLGLAIVKQTVEEMGGTIKVQSQLGRGTNFLLLFPVRIPDDTERTVSLSEQPISITKVPTKRLHLLMIDDEEMICKMLEKCLKPVFDITTTTCPQKGLEIFEKNNFDLVITDIKMPKISGLEVAQKLRSTHSNLPIVFISGHIDGDLDGKLCTYAPYELIEKPFSSTTKVIEIITNLCAAKESSAA